MFNIKIPLIRSSPSLLPSLTIRPTKSPANTTNTTRSHPSMIYYIIHTTITTRPPNLLSHTTGEITNHPISNLHVTHYTTYPISRIHDTHYTIPPIFTTTRLSLHEEQTFPHTRQETLRTTQSPSHTSLVIV